MTTDAPGPVLETERLVLRRFTVDDEAEVARLAGDRAIADTTLAIPHPYGFGVDRQDGCPALRGEGTVDAGVAAQVEDGLGLDLTEEFLHQGALC